MEHDYGLDWIDQEALYEKTKHVFGSALKRKSEKKNPPDPFTLMAQAIIAGSSLENVLHFEVERKINKTLSNSVGLWHQHVLSLAPGWVDLGSNGGGIDLKMEPGVIEPRFGKPLVAEVKNRFNTIKASDEKEVWDTLDLAAKTHGAVAYIFQIVPKTSERYDQPWKVSGRPVKEHIRCCDGATAYDMVFKRENALKDLYEVFPLIMDDVVGDNVQIDHDIAEKMYSESIPE
ncbi:Eco47II family restriction endonuclease [Bifidobacterium sp. DSM 109960]|uniref:Eco47II family restriction endonuclease n=1 Tax=Bifidobacterium erythrocebi TaxID=2675325 RepID=A0A7Y0ES20_9BIFI|nr:Eco47II family restriction endonuclease [Bifidobacterium sp. DSM 109960]NMM95382.1 Eco47II family restriction endonuclease [Bifidobacterium sp. DSM 109960]